MGKKVWLFLACMLMTASTAFAQQQIAGAVIDAESGEPLIGVAVRVPGTDTGAVTGADGKFSIYLPEGKKNLSFNFMGMRPAELPARNGMVVRMQTDTKAMDEVMVVAYGTATKATFTGAASVVGSEVIEDRPISNITNALAGNVAGVTATKDTGQPGTSSTVRIRGFGSINAGMDPLYVLDGMPYEGDISAISPDDVESMSVLKDAAAAALYGSRGANGVIMITTKKGRRNQKAQVSVSASWGANMRQLKNYDVIKSTDTYMEQLYRSNYNNAIYNLGYSPASAYSYASKRAETITGYPLYTVPKGESLFTTDGRINPNATLGYSDGTHFYTPDDWEKEALATGFRHEYEAAVQGGSDKFAYYFSAGYLKDEGIIRGSSLERISTRANVEYQPKKWLKLSANLAYTNNTSKFAEQSEHGYTSSNNSFYMANYMGPVYPMYIRDAQGNIIYNKGIAAYDYGDGTITPYVRNVMSIANPTGDLMYQNQAYLMDIFNGRWAVDITPVEGLTLTAKLGMNLDNTRQHYGSSNKYGQAAAFGGEAMQIAQRTLAFTQHYMANYRNTFNRHSIDVFAAYESYDLNDEFLEGYGQNVYNPGNWAVNNAIDQRRGYGSADSYATRSFLSRANYDYDEKYFASVSFRRDGSSRFHPDNRWGTFWSASAAWVLNKENFLSNAKWIDLLKLRASFGQQGNDDIGNYYAYVDQFTMSGSNGVFSDGSLSYKGNKDLTWEKSNAFDIAVDFEFWDGRLSGSLDYYNRTTKDMLYNKPVAPSNGYSSIAMNIGSMRNQGIELDLHGTIFKTKDFTWTADFNITRNFNEILELSPDLHGQLIDGSVIYQEGKSMYQYYLVKYAGVDPGTGLALYWAKDDNGTEYATADYSTAYTTNRCATGNMEPKFTGGLGTSLKFFNFDFSVQCSYQFGGQLYDNTYRSFMNGLGTNYAGYNIHSDILNAWTPQNTNTDVPRLCADDQYANSNSTRFLITSNYFSINNITLGYTIPANLTKKIGIENVRVYFSADNLALFSARQGLDPRLDVRSASSMYYGALRTITGGIKVSF
ncbi:MAG: TonB-dependent receptor [Bacteroidaceae bacterium]|nr:TonB-dependent receptor [Bacteroidaceae bacterium]